jgi:HSP20 family protein
MSNVNFKTGQARQAQSSTGKSYYYVTGIVNWHLTPHPNVWRPPTDVFETEDKIIVRIEIAGMHDGEFLVNYDQGFLMISGTRTEIAEKRAFHEMEIHFGEFLTEVDIPVPVDLEKIEAVYQDGFLRVSLPKALPKQIKINQE